MRPPVPVVIDAPSSISGLKLPDSTFLVWIGDVKMQLVYAEDTIEYFSLQQLDSLIDVYIVKSPNARLALRADHTDKKKEVDSVIALLKRKEIYRFNLITDLEK